MLREVTIRSDPPRKLPNLPCSAATTPPSHCAPRSIVGIPKLQGLSAKKGGGGLGFAAFPPSLPPQEKRSALESPHPSIADPPPPHQPPISRLLRRCARCSAQESALGCVKDMLPSYSRIFIHSHVPRAHRSLSPPLPVDSPSLSLFNVSCSELHKLLQL